MYVNFNSVNVGVVPRLNGISSSLSHHIELKLSFTDLCISAEIQQKRNCDIFWLACADRIMKSKGCS